MEKLSYENKIEKSKKSLKKLLTYVLPGAIINKSPRDTATKTNQTTPVNIGVSDR